MASTVFRRRPQAFRQTTLTFIDEVRKRPCIYDSRDPDARKDAWEEIGAILMDGWHQFSQAKKDNTVRDMSQKWRSMRDSFAKSVRKEKAYNAAGIAARKRKRYIYYKEMQFLIPYIGRRSFRHPAGDFLDDSQHPQEEEDVKIHVDNMEFEDHSLEETESKSSVPHVEFVAVTPDHIDDTNDVPETVDPNDKNISMSNNAAKILSDLVTIHKEDRSDPHGNRAFLMSLLPFLKKMPDDVNLDVRLQLLSVVKSNIK